MSETSYGILLPSFWNGTTGQSLRARGKDAVILAAYMTANPFANMIGLYELSLGKVERALPVLRGRKTLRRTIESLAQEQFLSYDFRSEFVWVIEMARVRLQLAGVPMAAGDKRRLGAVRLYEALPVNPFLGPFYERYCTELRLTRRRGPVENSKGALEGTSQGVYLTPSITSVRTGSGSEDQGGVRAAALSVRVPPETAESAAPQTARQTHPKQNPDDNVEVITQLVEKEILPLGLPDQELDEAVKARCAQLHIAYSGSVVRRAIESAQFRQHLKSPLFPPPSGVPRGK